jgi:hypothetical protein
MKFLDLETRLRSIFKHFFFFAFFPFFDRHPKKNQSLTCLLHHFSKNTAFPLQKRKVESSICSNFVDKHQGTRKIKESIYCICVLIFQKINFMYTVKICVSIRRAARYDLFAAVRVDITRICVIQNKNLRADSTRMHVESRRMHLVRKNYKNNKNQNLSTGLKPVNLWFICIMMNLK